MVIHNNIMHIIDSIIIGIIIYTECSFLTFTVPREAVSTCPALDTCMYNIVYVGLKGYGTKCLSYSYCAGDSDNYTYWQLCHSALMYEALQYLRMIPLPTVI